MVILEYLSQCPSIDVESKNNNGRTALHYASQQGKLPAVKCLVEKCGSRSRDCVDKKNITPLHLAADNGHFDIVKYLCSNKVNCMAQDNNGTIPLHTAALKGFTDIVVLLAGQNNCNPMECDHLGRTALHCACQEGYLAIVQFLVEEKGCNPNVKEFDNNLSPLHYAIRNGQTHVVKYLCGLATECRDRVRRLTGSKLCVQSLSEWAF